MAASSGVRWVTAFVAASTFFSNDAIVAEESAARPRPLPARERKSRRVRICTARESAGTATRCRGDFKARSLFRVAFEVVSKEKLPGFAGVFRDELGPAPGARIEPFRNETRAMSGGAGFPGAAIGAERSLKSANALAGGNTVEDDLA